MWTDKSFAIISKKETLRRNEGLFNKPKPTAYEKNL
jgi:hypothetical protein